MHQFVFRKCTKAELINYKIKTNQRRGKKEVEKNRKIIVKIKNLKKERKRELMKWFVNNVKWSMEWKSKRNGRINLQGKDNPSTL